MKKDLPQSPFVKTKQPCTNPDCDSSDAMAIREDNSTFCFSCETNTQGNNSGNLIERDDEMTTDVFEEIAGVEDVANYKSYPITSRGISQKVVDHFGVKFETTSSGAPSAHLYPYTKDGEIVAYKKRSLPKSFSVMGNFKDVELFGQEQARGGKILVITEGEMDALAVAQAYSDYKTGKIFPVVGLPSASSSAFIISQLEFINSFEKVVIMTDNDEPGKKVRDFLCNAIDIGKAFVAKLPEKDANETLMKHNGQAIISAVWDAKEWSPAGIIKGEDIWDQYKARKLVESVPYPSCLAGLNRKLKGIRQGEITLFTSGTGSGKSTVIKEIVLELLSSTKDKVGMISLEESVGDTAEKFISMAIRKNLSWGAQASEAEERAGFDKVFGDERLVLLDHQGSVGDSSLIKKIERLAQMGCKYLILDHITIAVSEGSEGLTGNAAVDKMMSDLLKICKRHNVWLGIISHLRKAPSGSASFEEGNMASIDEIKGSGSIKQISFDIIAFSRNMTAETDIERNTIEFRVLKARFTGQTGDAGAALYDLNTGRLHEKHDVKAVSGFDVVEAPTKPTKLSELAMPGQKPASLTQEEFDDIPF